MTNLSVTAIANSNIAFIKYWGDQDAALRIPANSSISMNLEGLITRTRVTFDPALGSDTLSLNGKPAQEAELARVRLFLDHVRQLAGLHSHAQVETSNNFPMGAGIASSASAFAALSLAASAAAGLDLDERALSRLARRGSGSACRSVPGGFVEWHTGQDDESSYAFTIAPADHWQLADCIAVVSQAHKPTGSTEGHARAGSSPLQAARVADTPRRLDLCRRAILERDFHALAEVVELDSNLMHAVMITSSPALLYWQPATLELMQAVTEWRRAGWPVCFTVDAGPNVHVICPAEEAPRLQTSLTAFPGVERVLTARPGGPARLIQS
jgi:diphosphomevalonate decarboxylase